MTSKLTRLAAYALFLGTSASCASMAIAQSIPAPAEHSVVDANGVNLSTGLMQLSSADVSIGPSGLGGLTYTRYWMGTTGWRHTYFMSITTTSTTAMVSIGNTSVGFTLSGGVYTSDLADGSTLTATTSTFTYTASDGTVMTFDRTYSGYNYYGTIAAVGTSITSPTGEKITLTYKAISGGLRLQSVNNNSGYQLKFSYPTSTSFYISQVQAINNAVDYCDPAADSCSGFSVSWPAVTYATTTSGSNTMETVTDAAGRATRYTADSSARLIGLKRPSSTTADNLTVAYGIYDGFVSSVSNGAASWSYVWNTESGTYTVVTITDALSHTRQVKTYINSHQIRSDTDAFGNPTRYIYTGPYLTKVEAPEGNSTQYTYDARGNVTSTTLVPKLLSGLSNITTSASYDSTCTYIAKCNEPNTTTDERGQVTTYTYDNTTGVLTNVAYPIVSSIAPTTRNTYNQSYAYYKNSSGTIVAAASPIYMLTGISQCATTSSCTGGSDEVKTNIAYGSTGVANNLLPTSSSSGSGDGVLTATSSFAYDYIGNRTAVDGPLPGTADTTIYFYDADREVTKTVGPDPDGGGSLKNRAVRVTYNPDGQVTETTQGTDNSSGTAFVLLRRSMTTYDTPGRKIQDSVEAGGTLYAVTDYSYDAASRPDCSAVRMNPGVFTSGTAACSLEATGAFGPDRISKNGYDIADRLTSVTTGYATGSARAEATLTYTVNGKIQTVADAKNNLTTYEYDGLDRLSKTRYPSPTSAGTSSTTDYEQLTYDPYPSNLVASRRLRDGNTIGYTYDTLSRLTAKTYSSGDGTLSYTYDLLNRPKTVTKPSGNVITYTYGFNASGALITEGQPFGSASSQYDLAGRRTRLTWNDGYYVTYDYLVTGEMTAIHENGAASGPGLLATFAYDDLGQRLTLGRGNGTTTSAVYDYGAAPRLGCLWQDLNGGTTQAACSATPTASGQDQEVNFAYSPTSQISRRTSANDAYAWTQSYNVNRGYTANGLNQYTASGSIAPTYDARGNLTSAGGTTYGYSSENLLTSAAGATNATIGYDGLSRMIEYDTAVSTRFVYDGSNLIAEVDNPSGNVLRRYVHGPGDDEPLVWYEGAGTSDRRWQHADERGSIIAVSDGSGNSIAINSYDPWGIPQTTNLGRFQYTGQAWLPELGLYYYKARIYSATLGRFLQTDPTDYGDGLNWYAYVGNDPVNGRDPAGLTTGTNIDRGPGVSGSGTCEGVGCPGGTYYLETAVQGKNGDVVIKRQLVTTMVDTKGRVYYVADTPGQLSNGTIVFASGSSQNSHPFSLPTTFDGEDLTVTGTKMISDSTKYVDVGGRYYLNPNYNPPFEITLGQAITIPALIGAGAAAITSSEALFAGNRVGILNNNPYVRIGFGPGKTATNKNFYQQFRIVIGNKGSSIHIHIDIPGFIK
jgi:RHS repeat-associated protein